MANRCAGGLFQLVKTVEPNDGSNNGSTQVREPASFRYSNASFVRVYLNEEAQTSKAFSIAVNALVFCTSFVPSTLSMFLDSWCF